MSAEILGKCDENYDSISGSGSSSSSCMSSSSISSLSLSTSSLSSSSSSLSISCTMSSLSTYINSSSVNTSRGVSTAQTQSKDNSQETLNIKNNNKNNHSSHFLKIPPPPVEVKLFVGRVPRTFDENALRPIFSEFGTVGDVIIIRDRETGAHKGCAFVRMASITKADLAIRTLNNAKSLDYSIGQLQVKYAAGEHERLGLPEENSAPGVDQAKLFVGSLPKNVTEKDVMDIFTQFGNVDEVFIMSDDNKQSKGRSGCAFVKYTHKEEAFHAIANLNGKFTMPGSTRAMEVRFADNKKNRNNRNRNMDSAGSNDSIVQGRVGQTAHHWTEYFTSDGRPYYYSSLTSKTQWERPPEMDSVAPRGMNNGGDHNNMKYGGDMNTMNNKSTNNIINNEDNNRNNSNNVCASGAIGAQTHGPLGANIFVFHIPNEWTEHDLVNSFCVDGQIISARIASDPSTGRNKGFGFVSFSDIRSAVLAVNRMNGCQIGSKRLKVQIKRGEEQYAEEYANNNMLNENNNNAIMNIINNNNYNNGNALSLNNQPNQQLHSLHNQNPLNMMNMGGSIQPNVLQGGAFGVHGQLTAQPNYPAQGGGGRGGSGTGGGGSTGGGANANHNNINNAQLIANANNSNTLNSADLNGLNGRQTQHTQTQNIPATYTHNIHQLNGIPYIHY